MSADRLDLDALEALIDAGTKGTWRLDGTWWLEGVDYRVVSSEKNPEIAFTDDDDGALIVALRNAAPALIAAARDRDRWHEAAFAGQAHEAQLTAERDAAQAALARVEALHTAVIEDGKPVGCLACDWDFDGAWPCATSRAVAGEGQEAGA